MRQVHDSCGTLSLLSRVSASLNEVPSQKVVKQPVLPQICCWHKPWAGGSIGSGLGPLSLVLVAPLQHTTICSDAHDMQCCIPVQLRHV